MAAAEGLRVAVAVSARAGDATEQSVVLPVGARLRDALSAVGCDAGATDVGIWGRAAGLDTPLAEGDRVEVYRPLVVDPKVARRLRFKQQGARSTGLFAQRREGAKSGY
ncbi:RnfH family protein [Sphingomonas sp. NCPPB 2930]